MPRRGEVWWTRLDPTLGSGISKTRPCLVVSTNVLNERRKTVVVVPLSTSPKASPPILVPVRCADHDVVAVIDQIRAVSKERLKEYVCQVSTEHMRDVEDAVREILELD